MAKKYKTPKNSLGSTRQSLTRDNDNARRETRTKERKLTTDEAQRYLDSAMAARRQVRAESEATKRGKEDTSVFAGIRRIGTPEQAGSEGRTAFDIIKERLVGPMTSRNRLTGMQDKSVMPQRDMPVARQNAPAIRDSGSSGLQDYKNRLSSLAGGSSRNSRPAATVKNDATGRYGRGTIDLNSRKPVQNDDGTISTELSISINDKGKEVLIPTVVDGRIVSDEEAIQHYYDTGEHLGKFDTVEEADEYAERLHDRQDWYYNQGTQEINSGDQFAMDDSAAGYVNRMRADRGYAEEMGRNAKDAAQTLEPETAEAKRARMDKNAAGTAAPEEMNRITAEDVEREARNAKPGRVTGNAYGMGSDEDWRAMQQYAWRQGEANVDFTDKAAVNAYYAWGVRVGAMDDSRVLRNYSDEALADIVEQCDAEIARIDTADTEAARERLESVRRVFNQGYQELLNYGYVDPETGKSHKQTGRPADYLDGPVRYYKGRLVSSEEYYDYTLWDQTHAETAEELIAQDPANAEMIHAEAAEMWHALIMPGDDLLMKMRDEKEQGWQAEIDELTLTLDPTQRSRLVSQKEKAQKVLDQRARVAELEAGAPGDGEYHPEKQMGLTYDDDPEALSSLTVSGSMADKIYFYANHPGSGMMDYNGYNLMTPYATEGHDYAGGELMTPTAGDMTDEGLAYYMTPEQLRTFNAYYNSGDYEAAEAYFQGIKSSLMTARGKWAEEYYRSEAGKEYGGLAGLSTILTQPLAALSGIAGTVMALLGDEEAADPNSGYYYLQRANNTIRATRAQAAEEKYGKAGSFFVNVAYSVADNLVSLGIAKYSGMGEKAASRLVQFVMSGEATSAKMVESLEKGYDPTECVIRAVGAGVIEALTEKYSIEGYVTFKGLLSDPKALAKFIGGQMIAEGSEEVASDVCERIADKIISAMYGHEDEIEARIRELEAGGMPRAKAERQAIGEWYAGLGESFLSGALSAVPLGTLSAGANSYNNRQVGAAISSDVNTTTEARTTENGAEVVRSTGKEKLAKAGAGMKKDTQSYKLAKQIEGKLEKGQQVSNYEVGLLATTMAQESSEAVGKIARQTVTNMAADELRQNGVEEQEAGQYAELIAKAATEGAGSLTQRELNTLSRNKTAIDTLGSFLSMPGQMRQQAAVKEAASAELAAQESVRQLTQEGGEQKQLQKKAVVTEGVKTAAKSAAESYVADAATLKDAGERTGARDVVVDGGIGQIEGRNADGTYQVKTADGSVQNVEAEDLQTAEGTLGTLVAYDHQNKGAIDGEGFRAILDGIDKNAGMDGEAYVSEAMRVYLNARTLGTTGKTALGAESLAAIEKAAAADNAAQKQIRLNKGAKQAQVKPGQGKATIGGAQYGTKEFRAKVEQLYKEKKITQEQRTQIRGAAELAQRLGFNVDFVYQPEMDGTFGWESGATGQVTINLAGRDAEYTNPMTNEKISSSHHLMVAMSHELTHWLEQNSAEQYDALRKFVFDTIRKNGGSVENLLMKKISDYREVLQEDLNVEGAMAEIVADACDQVLGNERIVSELRKTDPGLFGKVQEFVRKIVARIRAAAQGMAGSMSKEAEYMLKDADELARIWLGARAEAMGRERTAQTQQEAEDVAEAVRQAEENPVKQFSVRQQNEAYAEAVAEGDMDRAQWYVNEAAERAGYTDRAFHGTTLFGFTKFDLKAGKGTIFVAYDRKLASTYMRGEDEIREISDRNGVPTNFYTLSDEEQQERFREYLKNELYRSEFISIEKGEENPGNHLKDKFVVKYEGWNGKTESTNYRRFELIQMLEENQNPNGEYDGIYDFYTRPGNQLVVDAEGEEWNAIPFDLYDREVSGHFDATGDFVEDNNEDDREWTATTREIAEWARKHGYDSVRINNVHDNGGQNWQVGSDEGYGDIGIFFNEKDVKSADPATYDDQGKLIPLSERFNSEEKDIRYSARQQNEAYAEAVERGDMETAQRMVDEAAKENGYTKKVYHGTPAGGFTVFRDWSYFTENKEYADRYQTPSASSVRGKYVEKTNPMTYGLYMNPGRVFDTRSKKAAALYNEIRMEQGMGELNDSGLPDWTEGRDLIEYIEENNLPYDTIILDEGADGGYGEEVRKRGVSYVTRSNMVKSADPATYDDQGKLIPLSERFNSEEKDIRYSVREGSVRQTEDGTIEDSDGNAIAEELPGGVVTAYSLRTVDKTVNDDLIRLLIKKGYGKKNVEKWVEDVRDIAKMIADNKAKLDFTAVGDGMLKNNQEYVKTLDASTLCVKRQLYQGIYNEIQHMLPNTPLMPEDLIKLTNMMKQRELTSPCSLCYVESRRRLLGKYTAEWLKGYEGAYKPRMEELTTTDGLAALKEGKKLENGKAVAAENSEARMQAYEDYIAAMKAKGSANPKIVQLRGEYRGEIMEMTEGQIKKVKEIGGLRVQSFSDFEVVHMLDMMQAVMDMAARELTSQAYTKVPAFAWVFGATGIKINLSLIGEGTGLDENGNLLFSSTEGMDIDEALRIRDEYSKNVGTILVGMNDDHIIAAMGDDRIDFIIPFHKSGWGKKEMALMIGMGSYKDFTRWQNEKKIADVTGGKVKTIPNKKSKLTNFEPVGPNGYWNFQKDGEWNARKYLRKCAEDKRVPKFANFLVHDGNGRYSLPEGDDARSRNIRKGYWKLLIDFKMYDNDGVGSKQVPVRADFNMDQARKILGEYEGGADSLPTNHALAKAFADEYKAEHPGKKSFSIRTPGSDMEVRTWMLGLNESGLETAQERTMLKQFKDTNMALEMSRERIRQYTGEMRKLEAKENPTAFDRAEMTKTQNKLQIAWTRYERQQNEMSRILSDKGYAGMMYREAQRMNNLVGGKTMDQVKSMIGAIEMSTNRLNRFIDEREKVIRELADSQAARQIQTLMTGKRLDVMAKYLRANYRSSMNKQQLMQELAGIKLKLEAGQDVESDVRDLAARLVERAQGAGSTYLELLKGTTIRLGPGQMAELKAQGSSLKEVRSILAGTGIKVAQAQGQKKGADLTGAGNEIGSYGALDSIWDELCDMIPALDRETSEKDQLGELLAFVEGEKQAASGEELYKGHMDDVEADVLAAAAAVEMNKPRDPAAMAILKRMNTLIGQMAGDMKKGAEAIAEIRSEMREMAREGRLAADMTADMKATIKDMIRYNNALTEQSEAVAWQKQRIQLIAQLKSEHTQALLNEQEKWKQKIAKDKQARALQDEVMRLRRSVNTNIGRVRKLLVNETPQNNVPEHMKTIAREMIRQIVENDMVGRKISGIDPKDMPELMRLITEWEKQDGRYSPEDLKEFDEGLQDALYNAVEDIRNGIFWYNRDTKGKDIIENLEGFKSAMEQVQNGVATITGVINAQRQIVQGNRKALVMEVAYKVQDQTGGRKHRELKGRGSRALTTLKRFIADGNITPEYFFKWLKNAGLDYLWEGYHQAENRNGLELQKAQKRLAEIAEKHGYAGWDTKQKITLDLEKGGRVDVTLGQLMSLWATWKRENTLGPAMSHHLVTGGFYAEQDLSEGKPGRQEVSKKAHRVTAEDMIRIEDMLTDEQRAFVNDVVGYMSTDMSEMGNQASMDAYGIKMYKESYYFPMKMWDGIKSRKSNDAGNAANADRAFHPSFSKSRKHGAGNALMIGDFMTTAADHIVGMINYATIGLANENMQKVLNAQVPVGNDMMDMTQRNIRAVIEEAYGRDVSQYMENLKQQLNGGAVQTEKSLGDKAISLFRKNAVAGSMSVTAQQPLSYIRAAIMIHPKYLIGAISPKYWKGSHQEMLDHSGVAVIKEMGRFDMALGQSAREFVQPEGLESRVRKIWNRTTELATVLPEKADMMTWTRMWSAVKLEQHDLHPEMDIHSEEFLDKVAERFNEVMRRTQVYDSVLVKSANMRSQNYWTKGITSFMAEPTLTLNVLADAVKNAGSKGGKLQLAKAAAAFLMSAAAQAAVKAVFSTGRTPDEKKTWEENFLYRFLNNLIGEVDPLTLIPGYSDLVTLIKDGELQDDAMGALGKIITAAKTGFNLVAGKEGKGVYRDLEDSVGQLVQLFTNLPAKNIMRDLRAGYNWFIEKPYADRPTSGAVIRQQAIAGFMTADNLIGAVNKLLGDAGYKTTNDAYYGRIADAQIAGDEQTAADIREYMELVRGKEPGTINKETAGIIADRYEAGEISREDAERMYREANPDKDPDEAWFVFDRIDYQRETGTDPGTGKYYRLYDAMEANKAEDIKAAIAGMVRHGMKEKNIRSQINSHYKDLYLEADADGRRRILDAMQKAYKLLGYEAADAAKVVNGWK